MKEANPRLAMPIVYVRGYAALQSEVEETVDDPFYGFSAGSTHIRVNARNEPQFFAFESPLIRLMKDFDYRDAYHEGAQERQPSSAGLDRARTVWIYRYYDATAKTFLWHAGRLSMESLARDLRSFIKNVVLAATGAPKVWLVAHSMGGLIARCMIQKIALEEKESAFTYVDKFVTYGTPHGGIRFSVPGGGFAERVRDRIGWHNSDDFGPQRMYGYLTPNPAPSRAPRNFDGRVMSPAVFPLERMLCIIGTNAKDYTIASGISRRAVGPQSDGLVQIRNAYVLGAHRAFIHRSHSGRYGMVNSEEGYQNLSRFLFGELGVSIAIRPALLPSKPDSFLQADIRVVVPGVPVAIHERSVRHLCPILLSRQTIDGSRNQESGQTIHHARQLFTVWLMPANSPEGETSGRFAISIAIYRSKRDEHGDLRLGGYLAGVPLWGDSLVIDLLPSGGPKSERTARYTWATSGVSGEALVQNTSEQTGYGFDISLPGVATEKLESSVTIQLRVAAPNSP